MDVVVRDTNWRAAFATSKKLHRSCWNCCHWSAASWRPVTDLPNIRNKERVFPVLLCDLSQLTFVPPVRLVGSAGGVADVMVRAAGVTEWLAICEFCRSGGFRCAPGVAVNEHSEGPGNAVG
jgi:hypothetical protein